MKTDFFENIANFNSTFFRVANGSQLGMNIELVTDYLQIILLYETNVLSLPLETLMSLHGALQCIIHRISPADNNCFNGCTELHNPLVMYLIASRTEAGHQLLSPCDFEHI